MGGKSSSSSSSSSQTTTENHDNRVAVEAGGVGIGANAVVDVTLTDFGIVEGAAAVVDSVLVAAAETVDNFTKVVTDSQATLRENLEGDTKEVAELGVKVMGIMAVAAAVILIFGRKG